MDNEEWRVIPSFPDYEVSERGRVRRLTAKRGAIAGKIMKPWVRDDGYRMFILRKDGRSYHRRAHQLVADAYLPPKPHRLAEVRHLKGAWMGDHWSNLAWGTSAENKADMIEHGTRLEGERHPLAKLTADQVSQIRSRYDAGELQRVLAEEYGISQTQVSRICRGVRW